MGATWVGTTPNQFAQRLIAIGNRARDGRPITQAFGRKMSVESIPNAVQAGGKPVRYPPVIRYGALAEVPLVDTGKLIGGINFAFGAKEAQVVTRPDAVQARLMHFGGIVHGNPWLTIPQVPPLTIEEARSHRPSRSYKGAFPMKRPEGLGIYRHISFRVTRRGPRGGRISAKAQGVEMIFRLVRSVKIPPRPFMVSQEADRIWLLEVSGGYIVRGER